MGRTNTNRILVTVPLESHANQEKGKDIIKRDCR